MITICISFLSYYVSTFIYIIIDEIKMVIPPLGKIRVRLNQIIYCTQGAWQTFGVTNSDPLIRAFLSSWLCQDLLLLRVCVSKWNASSCVNSGSSSGEGWGLWKLPAVPALWGWRTGYASRRHQSQREETHQSGCKRLHNSTALQCRFQVQYKENPALLLCIQLA